MNKFWYPIRIFAANVFNRPLAASSAIMSLLFLFLLVELIWITRLTVDGYYHQLMSTVEMEVFFDEVASDSTITAIRKSVLDDPDVSNIDYISKESARLRLQDLMGSDLLEGLDENPLPRSLIVTFKNAAISSDNLLKFADRLSVNDGVTEIHYPGHWLAETEKTLVLLFWTALVLGLVILVTSALNVVHAIRLTVRVRQDELRQLKYLGAGTSIVAQPLLLEGLFYTLMASVISWVIALYLQENIQIGEIVIMRPPTNEIIISCLVAVLMGMAGGYLGVKRAV